MRPLASATKTMSTEDVVGKNRRHPPVTGKTCFCGLPLDLREPSPWWVLQPLPGSEWVPCMWCGRSVPLFPKR